MKTIIIEDEINAYEYLQSIIKKVKPNATILAHLESVEEAINWLHQHPEPDVIFLDIQLSDGPSFEIFKHIEVKSPIIFTTAYDQYAIDAFKVNSIDYLLKPIHIDDLKRAIHKFDEQQLSIPHNLSAQLQQIFRQEKPLKKHRCLVKKGKHFEYINVSDIAFVVSEDGITFLHTFKAKRFIYTKTLENFMSELDERTFFQINRSQILNINAIHKIHPYFNQRVKIELNLPDAGIEWIVSRLKVGQFKAWVDM